VRLVYIAGKYRGPNSWAIEQNIRAAEDLAAKVHAVGLFAVCPHANARHMEGVSSDEHMLAGTLELMRRCDAVILVHNWRDSAGSRAEVDEAKRLGIPVFGLAQSGSIDDGALAGLCRWARGEA
jgi:nucleoside 2-deoxyribosyltransferase